MDLAPRMATVVREEGEKVIQAAEVVPGDMVLVSKDNDIYLQMIDGSDSRAVTSNRDVFERDAFFSKDGRYILTAGHDKTAWLWDLQQVYGEHPQFIGHTNSVYGVAFSPDGQYLVTGGAVGSRGKGTSLRTHVEKPLLRTSDSLSSKSSR
jgi:WD40 repeat protein